MPTANPSIVIRFGTKKLQRHTSPSRPTTPKATPIAKIPMMMGVTPAISDPKTISSTIDRHDDADRLALLQVVFGDLLEVCG